MVLPYLSFAGFPFGPPWSWSSFPGWSCPTSVVQPMCTKIMWGLCLLGIIWLAFGMSLRKRVFSVIQTTSSQHLISTLKKMDLKHWRNWQTRYINLHIVLYTLVSCTNRSCKLLLWISCCSHANSCHWFPVLYLGSKVRPITDSFWKKLESEFCCVFRCCDI